MVGRFNGGDDIVIDVVVMVMISEHDDIQMYDLRCPFTYSLP